MLPPMSTYRILQTKASAEWNSSSSATPFLAVPQVKNTCSFFHCNHCGIIKRNEMKHVTEITVLKKLNNSADFLNFLFVVQQQWFSEMDPRILLWVTYITCWLEWVFLPYLNERGCIWNYPHLDFFVFFLSWWNCTGPFVLGHPSPQVNFLYHACQNLESAWYWNVHSQIKSF